MTAGRVDIQIGFFRKELIFQHANTTRVGSDASRQGRRLGFSPCLFLGDGSAFKGIRMAPYPQPHEVKQLLLAAAKCVRSFLFAKMQRFLSTDCLVGLFCFCGPHYKI